MSNDSSDALGAIFLVAILAIGVLVWHVSREIGASFTATLHAGISMLGAAAIIGVAWYFMREFLLDPLWGLITASLVWVTISWVVCWPLLDNIAAGGPTTMDGMTFIPLHQPWFDTGWAKWIGLILLAALSVASFRKSRQ